jgi:hypothetical protein
LHQYLIFIPDLPGDFHPAPTQRSITVATPGTGLRDNLDSDELTGLGRKSGAQAQGQQGRTDCEQVIRHVTYP